MTIPTDSEIIDSIKALNELLTDQLKLEQEQISQSHEILNELRVPANGPEGHGKRQELSLPQRIQKLAEMVNK